MAKFDDTPKWKKRDTYQNSTPAPKKIKVNPLAVRCPTSDAARRLPCHTLEGNAPPASVTVGAGPTSREGARSPWPGTDAPARRAGGTA